MLSLSFELFSVSQTSQCNSLTVGNSLLVGILLFLFHISIYDCKFSAASLHIWSDTSGGIELRRKHFNVVFTNSNHQFLHNLPEKDNQDVGACRADSWMQNMFWEQARTDLRVRKVLRTRGIVSPDYSEQRGFPLLGIFKVRLSLLSVWSWKLKLRAELTAASAGCVCSRCMYQAHACILCFLALKVTMFSFCCFFVRSSFRPLQGLWGRVKSVIFNKLKAPHPFNFLLLYLQQIQMKLIA